MKKKNCQNILSSATREDKYIGRHHIIFKWQKKFRNNVDLFNVRYFWFLGVYVSKLISWNYENAIPNKGSKFEIFIIR